MKRREFNRIVGLGGAGLAVGGVAGRGEAASEFSLRYILSSALYGTTALAEILPEVSKTGAEHIDIWPRVHGNQREQIDEMGLDAFERLLAEHRVGLGCITQYPLGPFGLQDEMRVARRFGCQVMVTGAKGPTGLEGDELKAAIRKFVEDMKPHVEAAAGQEITIAIENHSNSLIQSPDSMKWFAEKAESTHLGIAFAPHHLPQDGGMQGRLIGDLGGKVAFFYAQQHGMGSKEKLPKEQELLQMPGRGELDFGPIVAALKKTNFRGFVEIFMHPVPRGIPILETTEKVTNEVNMSREYLEAILKEV